MSKAPLHPVKWMQGAALCNCVPALLGKSGRPGLADYIHTDLAGTLQLLNILTSLH